MSGLIWRDVSIDGARSLFANHGEGRVYVRERPGRVEAWHDAKKLGNFASIELGQQACEKHLGVVTPPADVTPKPKPKKLARPGPREAKCDPFRFAAKAEQKPASGFNVAQDPFLTGVPRAYLRASADIRNYKPPVRIEEERKLLAYPIADLSQLPDTIEERPFDHMISAPAAKPLAAGPDYCGCGAKLGRSGQCPALCTPITEPPVYVDRGPVGSTHIGRMSAPVWAG